MWDSDEPLSFHRAPGPPLTSRSLYLDYPRATVTPDRNEDIWRGGTRLLFRINDYWPGTAIFKYDRFDSKNQLFQSERILTGMVTSFVF